MERRGFLGRLLAVPVAVAVRNTESIQEEEVDANTGEPLDAEGNTQVRTDQYGNILVSVSEFTWVSY